MINISSGDLHRIFNFSNLIWELRAGFQQPIFVPERSHFDFKNPGSKHDSTLLLMPAWQSGGLLGVKIIVVVPDNAKQLLPSIQGSYLLFDAVTGSPLATIEAKTLTNYRTAAASALASSYLSRRDSKSLLMIGTGSLAPYLIRAHTNVRAIQEVYIWGRSFEKAAWVADFFSNYPFRIRLVKHLNQAIAQADIITSATLSPTPLIKGRFLRPGQHIDLVGSYKPTTREADDDVIAQASVFVDVLETATRETGDILIPLNSGILGKEEIKGDLFDLCQNRKNGRTGPRDITVFKSVGHALEDLVAARIAYESRLNGKG